MVEQVETMDLNKLLNADKFFKLVDTKREKLKLTWMEATVEVCDEMSIEIDDVYKLKLINPALKDRINLDAMNCGMLKKVAQLPL